MDSTTSVADCGRAKQARAATAPSFVFAVAALLTTGCGLTEWAHNGFKVGPNYSPPPAPVASEWIDAADPRINSGPAELAEWWQVFGDPVLNELIESAYRQNLTLRVAGARILEARARRGIAVGNLFPQLQEAFGAYTRFKLSDQAANPPPEIWFSDWQTGFNASWELDVWGRFRRAIEAEDAALDASVANYDDVLVILLADVATNYVRMRTFQERLNYARENARIQEESLKIVQERHRLGAVTERDVHQARTVLEQTRSLIPLFEAGARVSANRLCVLLGIPPEDLQRKLGAGPIPVAPPQVVIGIPADLVRRRPDVVRAERELAAQSARIGIAESDFYPRIAINGLIGLQAEQFADLFHTPGSMIGAVGPAFRWDILNYGRILNGVRIQDARFQQLLWAYQDRVLTAGQEAEDGIVTFLKSQQTARHLDTSVQAARRTVDIAYEQYRQGAVDYIVVYVFQSDLTLRQDQLAESRGAIALSLISLYRALGGGWEMRLTRDRPFDCPPLPAAAPTQVLEQVPPPETPGPSTPGPQTPMPMAPLPPSAASTPLPPKIGPVVPMLP
jgi:NodT family efflux transporter outer membrane factor (OMF) lipoprotein